MNFFYFILGGIIATGVAQNAYSANCPPKPTCQELGYTLSGYGSARDQCVGGVVVCPFDDRLFSCVMQSDIRKRVLPNWNGRVQIFKGGNSNTQSWTVQNDGYVMGCLEDVLRSGAHLYVNEVKYGLFVTGVKGQRGCINLKVSKGDKIQLDAYFRADESSDAIYFVPLHSY